MGMKGKGGNPPPNPLNIPNFELQALTENLPKRSGNPRKVERLKISTALHRCSSQEASPHFFLKEKFSFGAV